MMKKTILSTLLIAFISVTSFAQGIYIRSGSGYGLPISTTQIGENDLHKVVYNGNDISDTSSKEVVSASYGAGANFNVAVGYKFNENLILDLNMIYLAGTKFETFNRETYEDISYSSIDEQINTTYSRGLFINPSVIFSAGFGKGAPYARFGILVASPKIIRDEHSYSNSDGERINDVRWEYSGGVSMGYQTAIGMNWRITDRLDFYTETSFVSMTFYAKKGVMTENILDGVDYLDQLVLASREIEFLKEYDPTTPYDPNKPLVQPREARAFSYISAQVGVRFTLLKFGE